jgi:RimJ/RimL family protein N-acetyltransferase
MRHSFAPFGPAEAHFLSVGARIDFMHIDFTEPRWLCVTGYDDDDVIMGLCMFEFQNWFDAHFSIVIADRRCITRRVMQAMFSAVFSQATRITAFVEPWNADALRQAKLMGFVLEGFGRNLIEGDRDACVFGMLRDECRYLKRSRHALADATQSVPDSRRPAAV